MNASEKRRLEQEWLTTRMQGIPIDDFGDCAIRFYLTADLTMPDQFRDHYHVCASLPDSRFRISSGEASCLRSVDYMFVICNIRDADQMKTLETIMNELDLLGTEVPPLFLMVHSHDANDTWQGLDEEGDCRDLLMGGIDGIISNVHSGQVLVWEARLLFSKAERLSDYLSSLLKQHRADVLKAHALTECINATLWGYLRLRLAPNIPALDMSLIGSNGKHTIGGFQIGGMLGKGMSGSVYQLCLNGKASGNVVKMQPKTTSFRISDIRTLKRTIAMSEMLSSGHHAHPRIVKLHEVLHSPTHILLRMEDAGPENLYQCLVRTPLPAERVNLLLTQMLQVVKHLHDFDICHRDLKPENFIVQNTEDAFSLKLVDFDMAVAMKPGSTCSSPCGTVPFAAPEVLLNKEYNGLQADVWSMGLVVVEVLLGVRSLEAKLQLSKVTPDQGERMCQAIARVIKEYFQVGGVLLRFISDRCRREYRHLMPVCVPILSGAIRPQPMDRWDATMCYIKILELKA